MLRSGFKYALASGLLLILLGVAQAQPAPGAPAGAPGGAPGGAAGESGSVANDAGTTGVAPGGSTTDTTSTDETTTTGKSNAPAPNTGGEPLLLTGLGAFMAGGGFVLRRKFR